MKILIFGKNGQVGMSLMNAAKRNQIDYEAASRQELDITNKEHVKHFFAEKHDFDFVINAAAYTNVDEAEKDVEGARAGNHDAVRNLAEACKQFNLPLIHLSTDYVFDGTKESAYIEDDAPNPINVYGSTKLAGENAIKDILKQHIILRVSWVFSEFGKNFVKTMISLSETRDSFSVICDQFGSPTSAKSIAETIIRICKKIHESSDRDQYWGTYHFSDFPVTNWHQFATYIISQKRPNKNMDISPIATKDYPTLAARPKNSMLNTQKIQKIFGITQGMWMSEVDRIIEII